MNDPLGDDPMLAGVGQEYARVNAEQAAIRDIMARSGPVYFNTFGMDKQAQMYMKALMNYDGRNATDAETTWLNFLSSPNSLTSPLLSVVLSSMPTDSKGAYIWVQGPSYTFGSAGPFSFSGTNQLQGVGIEAHKQYLDVDQGGLSVRYGTQSNGAFLIADFKDPGWGYKSYNWIQTVSSSGEFEKSRGIRLHNPHIDGPRDPKTQRLLNLPFIFGASNPNVPNPGMTSTFSDGPRGESWFQAQVTLIGINSNGTIKALGSYSWGYYINPAGIPVFVGPTYSPNPSPFQQGIINNYNHK